MTRIFTCNFDSDYDSNDWLKDYWTITTSEKKAGTSSVGLYSYHSAAGRFQTKGNGYSPWVLGQYYQELYARVYIQFDMYDTAGSFEAFFSFAQSITDLGFLTYDWTNNKILARSYGGIVGEYSWTWNTGQWYCFEVHYKRHETDGIMQVKLDSTMIIDYSGYISTYATGIDSILLRTKNNYNYSNYNYFDLLVVDDSDWIGPYLEGLYTILGDMTLTGTGEAPIEGTLSKTFDGMTMTGVVSNNFLDLPSKRASLLQFQKPFAVIWPYPNSKISVFDRYHLVYLFSRDVSAEVTLAITYENQILVGFAEVLVDGDGAFTFTDMLLNGQVGEVTIVFGPAWQSG